MTETSRKDGDAAIRLLEKALISMRLVVNTILAGAVWTTITINGVTYNQNLQGSLLGCLVVVTLVLTALWQRNSRRLSG